MKNQGKSKINFGQYPEGTCEYEDLTSEEMGC